MQNSFWKYVPMTLVAFVILGATFSIAQQPGSQSNMGQQATAKPYHDGPIWDIAFIRVKAGMQDRYLRYLTEDWKKEQEAMKNAGYTLDYKVITTESHGPDDFDVILMTQFKNLSSLEANADKMEELGQRLFGGMQKIESGYEQRANYREVMADRLGREIILEPKGAGSSAK